LIFTIFVTGFVSIGVPYLLVSSGGGPSSSEIQGFRFIGFVPIALGAAMYLRCAWDFTFAGKGTPAVWDPPKRLVSRGLYRFVRNPMYVGIELILAGEAVAFTSLILAAYAALVWLWFHLFVVYYEEPTLKKKFGAAYEDYCRVVPRWIPNRGCAREKG